MILRQYCTVYPRPRLNVVMSVNLQVLLDDHIVKTMTMKGSPFVVPFEAELKEWESKLVSFTLTFFPFYLLTFFYNFRAVISRFKVSVSVLLPISFYNLLFKEKSAGFTITKLN